MNKSNKPQRPLIDIDSLVRLWPAGLGVIGIVALSFLVLFGISSIRGCAERSEAMANARQSLLGKVTSEVIVHQPDRIEFTTSRVEGEVDGKKWVYAAQRQILYAPHISFVEYRTRDSHPGLFIQVVHERNPFGRAISWSDYWFANTTYEQYITALHQLEWHKKKNDK